MGLKQTQRISSFQKVSKSSWISVMVANVCEDAVREKIIQITDVDRVDIHPLGRDEETNPHVHPGFNFWWHRAIEKKRKLLPTNDSSRFKTDIMTLRSRRAQMTWEKMNWMKKLRTTSVLMTESNRLQNRHDGRGHDATQMKKKVSSKSGISKEIRSQRIYRKSFQRTSHRPTS